MIVPVYPSRVVPLEIFMAQKFNMVFFWVLIFAPIRSSLSLEIQSNLPPHPPSHVPVDFTIDAIIMTVINFFIVQHPGPEPDLTATLPLNPREYTDVFSPPIVLPSQKISSGGDNHFSCLLHFYMNDNQHVHPLHSTPAD